MLVYSIGDLYLLSSEASLTTFFLEPVLSVLDADFVIIFFIMIRSKRMNEIDIYDSVERNDLIDLLQYDINYITLNFHQLIFNMKVNISLQQYPRLIIKCKLV